MTLNPVNYMNMDWKDVNSSPSFRTHFKPGQTLFGKRRAYLRKVAYAEFEGICTQNILVFETKDPDVLLPELLPFICMSEPFMQNAIKNSSGSLFPNADWKAIREFKLLIPPIEEQQLMANVLWALDVLSITANRKLIVQKNRMEKKLILELFGDSDNWNEARAADIGEVKMGRQRSPKYTTGNNSRKYLRVINVGDGKLDLRDVEEMDFNETDFENYKLKSGDILITEGILSANSMLVELRFSMKRSRIAVIKTP